MEENRIVTELKSEYVVNLPEDLSNGRKSVSGEIYRGINSKPDIPVIFDFSGVKKFDSSGIALVCSLMMEYPTRKFYRMGMDEDIEKWFKTQTPGVFRTHLQPYNLTQRCFAEPIN